MILKDTPSRRHEELAKFLVSRRMRLLPESCGLHPPRRSRRRTPGLRRDEVSALAGISTAYYTWIEQGRRFDISRDVLGGISNALRLTDLESAHLFTLAGKPTPYRPATDEPEGYRDHALGRFVRMFASGPAILVTPWLDVIDSNRSACELLGIAPGTNLAEVLLCGANVTRVANADSLAPAFVALLRYTYAIDVENARFGHVIAALGNGSPAFRAAWDTHVIGPMLPLTFEVARHDGDVAPFDGLVISDPIARSQLALLLQPQEPKK